MRKETYRIRRRRDRWLRDEHDRAARRRDYRSLLAEESRRVARGIKDGGNIHRLWRRLDRRLVRFLRGACDAEDTPADVAAWVADNVPHARARAEFAAHLFIRSDRWNHDRLLRARALYRRAVAAEQMQAAFDRLWELEESMGLPD